MSELVYILISGVFSAFSTIFEVILCVSGALHARAPQGGVNNGHFGGQKKLCAIVRFSTS